VSLVRFRAPLQLHATGLWPTMKVVDRIKCMENFVTQMKRTLVKRLLNFDVEIGSRLEILKKNLTEP
jgi:hypothetical protein